MSDNKVDATFHTGESPEVTDEQIAMVNAIKEHLPATHAISMTAHVRTPEEFERIWLWMQHNMAQMGRALSYVSVHSTLLDGDEPGVDEPDPDPLYHDEDTVGRAMVAMVPVLEALNLEGRSDKNVAFDLVNALNNAGILLRERR